MNKLEIATIITYIAFIFGILPLAIAEYRIIVAVYMGFTGVCFAIFGLKLWKKRKN